MRGVGRHRKSVTPMGRTLGIVVAIHVVGGLGLVALSRTTFGQQLIKTYEIKLAKQDEPPPPPAEPPPPPPPPPEDLQAPSEDVAAPVAQSAASSEVVQVAAAGVGSSWNGRFHDPFGDGKYAAYQARTTRELRQCYHEPAADVDFGPARVVFKVSVDGSVQGYRLVESSGSAVNDRALDEAAQCVQRKGLPPPPGGAIYATARFTPYN